MIKDLEYDLGTQLLARTTRNTRLTWAGEVFLGEARRVLAAFEQAKPSKATGPVAADAMDGQPRRKKSLFLAC